MRLLLSTALAVSLLLPALPVSAAPNDNAKILVHLLSPTSKNPCSRPGAAPACNGIVTAGDLYPATYFAYVLVTDGSRTAGVEAVQFGVEYDSGTASGIDVYSWGLCGDAEFQMPGWPATATGNLISISSCVSTEPGGTGTGVVAVFGYFYLGAYGPDEFSITPRPVDGLAKVAACSGAESILWAPGLPGMGALGAAAFSAGAGSPGYNPCGLETALPTCSISGLGNIEGGTTALYSVSSPQPGATFEWTILGNGTITGSTTGSSVTVDAGGPGSFQLIVNVSAGGRTGTCQTSITVTAPPACLITGPSPVVRDNNYTYRVEINDPGALAFQWSITGTSASIVSQNGVDVTVYANLLGGNFTLTVLVTQSDGTMQECSKTVAVTATPGPGFTIIGPEHLFTGSQALYTAIGFSSPLQWTIQGDGTIIGSSWGLSVTVRADESGVIILETGNQAHPLTKVIIVDDYNPQPGINSEAKILVHLTEPVYPDGCADSRSRPACADVNSHGVLNHNYFAYLLLADCYTDGTLNSGVGGVRFGIEYDSGFHSGVDLLSWSLCGDLQFSTESWPFSGTGNTVVWDGANCQRDEPAGAGTGVVTPIGYLYMSAFTPGDLRVTPNPSTGTAAIADCFAVESVLEYAGHPLTPSRLGRASFSADGSTPGYSPCGPLAIPVQETTWGRIKAMFNEQ